MTGEFSKIVNRSKAAISIMFAGRSFVLAPGENIVDRALLGHAKRQARIMGTENPLDPLDFDSLIACPVTNPGDGACPNCFDILAHDCKPVEQSKKREALDRRLIPVEAGKKVQIVETGLGFSRARIASDILPTDANFAADRT